MACQYFTREINPFQTVYEVDFDRGTWRIFGADASQPNTSGELVDGGSAFHSVYFARLKVTRDGADTVTFRRMVPSTIH